MNIRFQVSDPRFQFILKLNIILVSIIWYLTSTTLVHAQSVNLSLSPPVVEILLRPNQQMAETFTLQTGGDHLTITPELHLFKPEGNTGHVTLDSAPLNPATIPLVVASPTHPLGTPIDLTSSSLSLTLTFESATTDVPLDVYLALVLKAHSPEPLLSSSETSPAISALILVTITPSGILPINLEIKDFSPALFHDSWVPLTLTPSLTNGTGTMIRPEGVFEVISPSGQTTFTLPLYPNLVLANSTRGVQSSLAHEPSSLTWSPTWHHFGPYRLRLTVNTQGGTKLTEVEKVIWILPLRLLLISLSLLTVLVFLFAHKPNYPIDKLINTP